MSAAGLELMALSLNYYLCFEETVQRRLIQMNSNTPPSLMIS